MIVPFVKRFRGTILQIGARLKEERLRVGIKQADLAAQIGIAKKSQTNYELGHSSPSADYLAAIADTGIDIQYVLTGRRAAPIAGDEAELLARYREAAPELRAAALRVLGVATVGSSSKYNVQVEGNHGQVFTAPVRQDKAQFHFGSAGKKGGKK